MLSVIMSIMSYYDECNYAEYNLIVVCDILIDSRTHYEHYESL